VDIIDCSGLWVVTLGVGGLFDCATAAFSPEVYESRWEAPIYSGKIAAEAYAAGWGTPDYAGEFEAEEYSTNWEPCP
jgi:hypothetical protein